MKASSCTSLRTAEMASWGSSCLGYRANLSLCLNSDSEARICSCAKSSAVDMRKVYVRHKVHYVPRQASSAQLL